MITHKCATASLENYTLFRDVKFCVYTVLWSPYVIGQTIYIFMLFLLLLSSFFIPRLISAATDWMSTILLHMAWP